MGGSNNRPGSIVSGPGVVVGPARAHMGAAGGCGGGGAYWVGMMADQSVFLSRDDMVALTGRRRRAAQVAALTEMAVPFWVNAAGWPVVAVASVEGGPKGRKPVPVAPSWESDKVLS